MFARSLIMVLSDYENEVIEAIIDPRSGLPSKQSFMPTIHEVKSALEAIEAPRRRLRERERAEEAQRNERKLISDQRSGVTKTYEELQAYFHEAGVMIGVKGAAVMETSDAAKERNAREIERQRVSIVNEWERDGKASPTVGDIPISKSLCSLIEKQTGAKAKV